MTSLSGKTDIDWRAAAEMLAPVEVLNEDAQIKKRSRDFFWYSPILTEALDACFGDLVAVPKTAEELAHCLKCAYALDMPVLARGGGTGNYGQAVPMDGGLILDMTAMNQVLEVGDGWVRAQAGILMDRVNDALKEHGQEMCMFPSTSNIATLGGFVAGGSAGIGSIANGVLRDPGNLMGLKVMDVTADPREHVFEGTDTLQIHHAWGLNGIITEVTLRTVPAEDWQGCIATFDSYEAAFGAGVALAHARDIGCKLISIVDARIVEYFPRLKKHIPAGRDLLVSMIPDRSRDAFRDVIEAQGGTADLILNDAERKAARIPHVYDFSYNHTTLQVLRKDRSATYQQYGCPLPLDAADVAKLRAALGDDVWMHHEFSRYEGDVTCADLPVIWYKDEAQLRAIDATYEAHGFPVYDAHTWQVEGGGLKSADYTHLAWKKRMDPKGLLNSAKSRAWGAVKDLTPEEIEARAAS
ncbi:MAG: FAD-binding oxidoreductase [Pseudomonadota bacterium]